MNLLYLANVVVAEVGGDYYWHWTHDQEIGKALVAAGATVIAALIAIAGVVLTVRKTTLNGIRNSQRPRMHVNLRII